MNGTFEPALALVTGVFSLAVGISVLMKKHASTHALTELLILAMILPSKFNNQILQSILDYEGSTHGEDDDQDEDDKRTWQEVLKQSIESNKVIPPVENNIVPNMGNAALLITLGLEVFGISIPDSWKANLVLAILNIIYGFFAALNLCFWFWFTEKFGDNAQENEIPT